MTKGKTFGDLKAQLEANVAILQARFDLRPDGSTGGNWFELSEAEEEIFQIDRDRFPRMVTTYECYEALKGLSGDPQWDEKLIDLARRRYPAWSGAGTDEFEFYAFAKALGGLTNREANAIWCKQHFWTVRLGVVTFRDERQQNTSDDDVPC